MLPAWLSHPSVVSSDIKSDCVRVTDVEGLDRNMVSVLKTNGIKKLFPGLYSPVNICGLYNISYTFHRDLCFNQSSILQHLITILGLCS